MNRQQITANDVYQVLKPLMDIPGCRIECVNEGTEQFLSGSPAIDSWKIVADNSTVQGLSTPEAYWMLRGMLLLKEGEALKLNQQYSNMPRYY